MFADILVQNRYHEVDEQHVEHIKCFASLAAPIEASPSIVCGVDDTTQIQGPDFTFWIFSPKIMKTNCMYYMQKFGGACKVR